MANYLENRTVMKISPKGIAHLHEFEGLELEAYPDPGSGGDPWTIGYGHTGPDVHPGLVISLAFAEELLKNDLQRFEEAVEELINVEINQNEFDALVSFTYNTGEGALKDSTLRRRLNAGEDKSLVFSEELPRWVNGANGPMPGLIRRRDAEVKMALTPVDDKPTIPGNQEPKDYFLPRAAKYFNAEPHQEAAWRALEDSLTSEQLEAFKAAYSPSQPPVEAPKPSKPRFPLDVPYFNQNDSATDQGGRMCFTSSMAMALDYIDPDVIKGDDDWYLYKVLMHGDTVSGSVQEATARSLGFEAEFRMDGHVSDLEKLLDEGIPVPVGILHHGPASNPIGGGHWITLIGYDDTHFWVNDPAGDLDLINGGYHNWNSGKSLRYSKKNFLKRWNIHGDNDGWFVDLRGNS